MPNGLPEPGGVGIPRDAKSDNLCIPTFSKDTYDNDTAQAIYMSDRFFLENVLRDEIIYEGTCPGLEASPGCCSGKGERVSTWQRWVGLTDTERLLPPGGGCLGVSCSSGGWVGSTCEPRVSGGPPPEKGEGEGRESNCIFSMTRFLTMWVPFRMT